MKKIKCDWHKTQAEMLAYMMQDDPKCNCYQRVEPSYIATYNVRPLTPMYTRVQAFISELPYCVGCEWYGGERPLLKENNSV